MQSESDQCEHPKAFFSQPCFLIDKACGGEKGPGEEPELFLTQHRNLSLHSICLVQTVILWLQRWSALPV